jgi:hypothetical protein
MPKLESSIERAFRDWVKRDLGLKARKLVDQGEEGFPDRTIILPGGRIVCVEFKSETGHLRPGQARRIAELQGLSVPVLVTSNLREAKQWTLQQLQEKCGPHINISSQQCPSSTRGQA